MRRLTAGNFFNIVAAGRATSTSPASQNNQGRVVMQRQHSPRAAKITQQRSGKIKYGIFAWLLGLPLPIIILALFFRGCDF